MTNLILFRVKGRNSFTGAITGDLKDPYAHYKVSCKKGGRKYLREPTYLERKRIHKHVMEHSKEIAKAEKIYYLGDKI